MILVESSEKTGTTQNHSRFLVVAAVPYHIILETADYYAAVRVRAMIDCIIHSESVIQFVIEKARIK